MTTGSGDDDLLSWLERVATDSHIRLPRHFVASALLASGAERYAEQCGVNPIEALPDAAVVLLHDAARLLTGERPDGLTDDAWPVLQALLPQMREHRGPM
ncbi:MAG: hypothetical protein ACLQBX_19155 [Candidatus Limnocylindrales bacterium]